MMNKQTLFTTLFVLFSLFLFGCQPEGNSKGEASKQEEPETVSLNVQVDPFGINSRNMISEANLSQNANFSLVDRITVEVKLNGSTVIVARDMVKSGELWSIAIGGLLPNKNYSFIARAYENGSEAFNGSTSRTLSEENEQLYITLSQSENVYLPIPKITQIIRPTKLLVDTTSTIRVFMAGSSNETLNYEFSKDSTTDLGSFTTTSGMISLAGSTGEIVTEYTAPSEPGSYKFSVKVSNSRNNSVAGKFRINVNQVSTALSMQVPPVIHGMGIQCAGNQLIWTASATGYDGTNSLLNWQWQFDGSSDAFQNPTENGAVMSNYNRSMSGPVTLTLTDQHENGTTATATWQLEKDFCAEELDSGKFKVQAFDEFQSINTNGAFDWESFQIGSDSYLAVANHINSTTSTRETASKIYRWNGSDFEEFQSIDTVGAMDWEFFRIGSDYYLAVANYGNNTSSNVPSKIYKWNGARFEEFQSINTAGAFDWEFFQIGSDSYLAVANGKDDTTGASTVSKIYKWSGTTFEEFQSINTHGTMDFEFFRVDTTAFLAVTNDSSGFTTGQNAKIYKWSGSSFEEFKTVDTDGAMNWEAFQIGSNHFVAVTNHSAGTAVIYQWDGTTFKEFQTISRLSINALDFFQVGSDSFLGTTSLPTNDNPNLESVLYKWNGANFEPFQTWFATAPRDWQTFQIENQVYFAIANYYGNSSYNTVSTIYKARFE